MTDTATTTGAGDTTTTTTVAADTTATTTTTPWHQGKLDAELLGHVQNKGWKAEDPIEVAVAAVRAHREAERHIGVPADQILRLPKDKNDEAGWKSVWDRLGAPAEAKDYDFTAVKSADGTAIDQAFADAIRQTAFELHIPKDAAPAFAQSVVKHLDGVKAASTQETQAKLGEERAALDRSWGKNKDANMFVAKQAAAKLGVDPEAVAALENTVGYAKVMEMFRKVGAQMGEDIFVDGSHTGEPRAMTREQAVARKSELMRDGDFAKRFLDGDAKAVREMTGIDRMIAGVFDAA